MFDTDQETVGTSAVEVVAKYPGRYGWAIYNAGTVDIFIGPDSAVTTANGFPIPAGTSFGIARDNQSHHPASGPVYAISGSAAQDVRIATF
jgi:hypothetical protein